MFVVPNGDIIISNNDCSKSQVLHGIYITKNNIKSDTIYVNNNLANNWCDKGNLEVRGILI